MEVEPGVVTAAPTSEAAEVRFRAMGTECHVLITGPDGDRFVDQARRRVDELEQRWSRFLPDSEVSRLSNEPMAVSSETMALVNRAVLASRATNGLWNPLMGNEIAALGYDRSYTPLLTSKTDPTSRPAALVDGIVVDEEAGTVQLPSDARLDVGGIAKGFAADLITAELIAAGAWGALINLGGDLRVRGLPPTGLDWVINVSEPALGLDRLTTVRLSSGAVCTSTSMRRRWAGPNGERHHLLDPRTSLPGDEPIVLTTAIAGEGWWAEAAATALLISPDLPVANCSSLQVTAKGTSRRDNNFERYEAS